MVLGKLKNAFGLKPGKIARDVAAVRAYFDVDFYRESNPHLELDEDGLIEHYLVKGWRDGADPAPDFSTLDYLYRYSDVEQAGVNPLAHYVLHGFEEGRQRFDSKQLLFAKHRELPRFIDENPDKRPIKCVALIGDVSLDQCKKFRVLQLRDFFEQLGIKFIFSSDRDIARSLKILQFADAAIFYRLQMNVRNIACVEEAKRLGIPTLYDIDDPLFDLESYQNYGCMAYFPQELQERFLRDTKRWKEALSHTDYLLTSTPEMRDILAEHSVKPVFLRRNFMDRTSLLAAPEKVQREQNKNFTITFPTSSLGREADMSCLKGDVERFLRDYPDAVMKIIGPFAEDFFSSSVADQVQFVERLSYEEYLNELSRADCVVLPLNPDKFNSGKSAIRFYDTGLAGVACIASKWGEYANSITHGENGLLAFEEDDWYKNLTELYINKSLRVRLGERAREDAFTKFSYTNISHIADEAFLHFLQGDLN